jgi:hypothetical protein
MGTVAVGGGHPPTAAAIARVGASRHRVVHWNTVPWPTEADQPSADDLRTLKR